MNGAWEEGCKKEEVMMVVVRKGMKSWKSWEGKEDEGGRPQHHVPVNFSKTCQVNIHWRMEAKSSSNDGYGNICVGIHEHGEWEVASGGQEKELRPCRSKAIRNIKQKEVGGCWVWDLGINKEWSDFLQKQENKI
jgi:hypothetical protein